MITININPTKYSIQKIRKSSKTASYIRLKKEYLNQPLTIIPILGDYTIKHEKKNTTITVETDYHKETTPSNPRIYFPLRYENKDCIIAITE